MQNFRLWIAHIKFHQIYFFDRLLLVYRILVKKYRGLRLMTLNIHAKFEEKLCCFKNDKNLVKFDLSTRNSPEFALSFVLIVQSI